MPANAAPIALVRWLAGLSLLQTAESWMRRDADASAASALIAADAASETLLSLLGATSARPVKSLPPREELILRAQEALSAVGATILPSTLADLRSTHSLRNNVVHHGARAGNADTARACAVARDLVELLATVSSGFAGVPSGAGIASAVAAVVQVPDVGDELRRGDEAFIADDASGVAEAAGLALGRLLQFATPPLRTESERRMSFGTAFGDRTNAELVRSVDELRGQVDELRAWVVAPSLGVSPAVYSRVVAVTGYYISYSTTPHLGDEVGQPSEPPSMADARWVLERVAEMAFHLWQTDALTPRPERRFERMKEVVARNRERESRAARPSGSETQPDPSEK